MVYQTYIMKENFQIMKLFFLITNDTKLEQTNSIEPMLKNFSKYSQNGYFITLFKKMGRKKIC